MKKSIAFLAASFAAIAALAADPSVSGVSITQLSNRLVQVSYTLSAARAIVTPVFKLDGAPLDMATVVSLAGDVRRIVAPGERRFVWDPKRDWTGAEFDTARLSVDLTVWSLSAPPPKVVIDIDPMVESSPSNILYYVSEAELPGGVGDVRYRTTKLLMSLIPARNVRWRFGDGSAAKSKYVTLTKDFYMGAFPFTQGQGETALGTRGGEYTDLEDSQLIPMTASAEHLRNAIGANPPASDTYLAKLRSQTGVALDLPSEFQWEYAARGGLESINYGLAVNYGWWGRSNGGSWGSCGNQMGNCQRQAPHPVGLKRANNFGLYDIVGNCTECTRTAWVDPVDTTEETDPEGPTSSSGNYTMRSTKHWWGANWETDQRFYIRKSQWYNSENDNKGFRLILPVEPEAN